MKGQEQKQEQEEEQEEEQGIYHPAWPHSEEILVNPRYSNIREPSTCPQSKSIRVNL